MRNIGIKVIMTAMVLGFCLTNNVGAAITYKQGKCLQYSVGYSECLNNGNHEVPDYGPHFRGEWGITGSQIVISGCGNVTPAYFVECYGHSNLLESITDGPCTIAKSIEEITRVWFDYDPNYFIVYQWPTDSESPPDGRIAPFKCRFMHVYGGSGPFFSYFIIGLSFDPRSSDACDKLKAIKDKSVKVYLERHYECNKGISGQYCYRYLCDKCGATRLNTWYYTEEFLAEVGVVFEKGDFIEKTCESGGCSSCGSGTSELQIGNITAPIRSDQSKTLPFYGSVRVGTEVNIDGFWFRPGDIWNNYGGYTDWEASQPSYDWANNKVTKISFTVTAPNQDQYYYEIVDEWDDVPTASLETMGRIPLKSVVNGSNTKRTYSYDYDNNRATITGYTIPGQPADCYMIYEGGIKPDSPQDTLKRIWAGKNLSGFNSRLSGYPSSGRWVDMDVTVDPQSGIPVVSKVINCSDCSGGTRNYDYQLAVMGMENGPGHTTNPDDVVPTDYLISRQKDSNGDVLAAYSYDESDRLTKKWLGDNELPVTSDTHTDVKWYRNDGSFITTAGGSGSNSLTQRYYVDNTYYRAKVSYYNANRKLTKEQQYHNLQDGPNLTGPFSRTTYDYYFDAGTKLTKVTQTLPKGNKIHDYYATNSNKITKRTRDTEVVDQYEYNNDSGKWMLSKYTDAKGASTEYVYDWKYNLKTRIDPAQGVFGNSTRLTTYYEYDNDNRATKEWTSDSSRVSTWYDYDNIGNLTAQRQGALTTCYKYNEYNEQTKSYDIANSQTKNVRKLDYSGAGVVIGEYLLDGDDGLKVSATEYEYDGNGRLTLKKVANHKEPCTSPESWVSEKYLYDKYGRRTAEIADFGGKNLTTGYEYDNQSEVTKIIRPDNSSVETVKDGRGLVIGKIARKGTKQSVTSFDYDANGNLTRRQTPDGVCEYYKYDKLDRRIQVRKGKPSQE